MKSKRFFIITCGLCLLATMWWVTPHSKAQKNAKATKAQPVAGKVSAAYKARRAQLAEHGDDARYLLTRTAIFDPRTETPAPLRVGNYELAVTNAPAASANESDTAQYAIIQFQRTIQSTWTDSLRAQGIAVAGYLPNNAYIVKATPQQLQRARNNTAIRWIGTYGAALKVAPELLETNDGAPDISLAVLSFPNENETPLRDALQSFVKTNFVKIETRSDERMWSVVTIPRASLSSFIAALSQIESVEWIEERRPNHLHSDNVVRVLQTGFISNDAPLYRNGLTGAGQVFGIADSGLDSDHAQFRLDNSTGAQTLSIATTSADLVNGLLLQRITNQNNKVLSYFLIGSGSTADQDDNPNGKKTLDPNDKEGSRFVNAVAYDDTSANYHGTLTTSVAVGRNYAANGSGAVPGIATRSTGDGVAPDARIVFQDVGHPSGQLPGVDTVSPTLLHRQAYTSGVRVHNNSYGPAPPAVYDQDAADVDDMMWRLRDYTIFHSAGNNSLGDYQVTNAAKNNLVIGASESASGNVENLLRLSNHGPTFDGRIKPDLIAPGVVIGATERDEDQNTSSYGNSTSATAKDAAVNPDDPNNNATLTDEEVSGTSFASAAAAGSALLVRQYFADGFYPSGARNTANTFNPSNALIKAVMLLSGRNMSGLYTGSNSPITQRGSLPNAAQGWGRVALDDALYFSGDHRELRVLADIWNGATTAETNRPAPNAAITTGQTHTYQLSNVSNVEPLRITLAWSDPRAAVGAIVALVNDLNLEVVDPAGKVYRGNVNFAKAWSQPADGAAFDDRNPVEAVYIERPIAGTYTVRIIGANVPGNGLNQIVAQPGDQRIDSNKQGYALTATGNFTAGNQPLLALTNSTVSGGVNADRFISKNETVSATLTLNNTSALAANNVSAQLAVDSSSQVPANSVRLNGNAAGSAATLALGDVAIGATRNAAFQITLLDDGQNRAGQELRLRLTTTPANGIPFVQTFVIIAQMKLITYRTRFESTPEANAPGLIAIPERDWRIREDDGNRADDEDVFYDDWTLTTTQRSSRNGSTASLTDPSGAGKSYGVSETSRASGQVFDDSRWWTPKLVLPGLYVRDASGRVINPEETLRLKAEIDSFAVDVKADFTGDFVTSSSSGDFLALRVRPYRNSHSINSRDDAGVNANTVTNLLYLDADNVNGTSFVHYEGNDFAGGEGKFFYPDEEDDADDEADVFFRIEAQFRRNGFPQTGDGVFIDNLEVRLRVADTNVYAAASAGTATTVNAASYAPAVSPGQIVSAFGTGFPNNVTLNVVANSLPLPTALSNVSVLVDGVAAPLFFVGVGGGYGAGNYQINYQLPYETVTGTTQIEVRHDNRLLATEFLTVSRDAPGVFTTNATGQGQGAVLNEDYSPNSSARPERRGRYVIVYATGQGAQLLDATTRQLLRLPSGVATPFAPLYVTPITPTVTVGSVPAQVAFSGLAPGFVGLWQLNVLLPTNAPTGNAVPLVITSANSSSRVTTIAVN